MNTQEFRAKFGGGNVVTNGFLAIPSAFCAEVMAHIGWHTLTIDMQHGMIGYREAVEMMTAIATTPTGSIVRVRSLDEGLIMQALDSGAHGVICPMINTPADVVRLVNAVRYPPIGQRSFGPGRASLMAKGAYSAEYGNTHTFALAMIETREALERLNEILDVPGLDGVFVGPSDLSLALGYGPGVDRSEPEVVAAIAHIREETARRGQIAAIFTGSGAYARRMADSDYDMVSMSSDAKLLEGAARQMIKAFSEAS